MRKSPQPGLLVSPIQAPRTVGAVSAEMVAAGLRAKGEGQ